MFRLHVVSGEYPCMLKNWSGLFQTCQTARFIGRFIIVKNYQSMGKSTSSVKQNKMVSGDNTALQLGHVTFFIDLVTHFGVSFGEFVP